SQPAELLELGRALFLDRPLGAVKHPGEPDQTVLLSHRAFSRSLARRRLQMLAEEFRLNVDATGLDTLSLKGVPLSALAGQARPGAVSVADARQVAEDFLFVSTSPTTVRELFAQYDFSRLWSGFALEGLREGRGVLLVPLEESGALTLHDREMRPRLLLVPDFRRGYASRSGREVLRGGFQAVVVGDSSAEPAGVCLPAC